VKQCFIDSNVVVYANDRNAGHKQTRAIDVIRQLMCAQNGSLSIQVLQEYANVALIKLKQEAEVVLRQLKLLESLTVIAPTPKMVRRSVEIRNVYHIAFWDAAIIGAAEMGECDAILSEDLNTGQYYSGIEVVNPFASSSDVSEFIK